MSMISFKNTLLAGTAVWKFATAAVQAETIEIKGKGVKFGPDIIHAKVGDTLTFRQMATHFVESVEGMWPTSAPKMHSTPGADHDYQVSADGVYVFKCASHWGARMGAILIVGKATDLNATIDKYIGVVESDLSARRAKGLLTKFKDTLPK